LIAVKDGHREGEIGLELSIDAVHIYSITFLLARRYGEPALVVSRLQGRSDSAARDLVRQATKELHGTRPAALMLFLARHFAALLGCAQVVLVSNQNRVALNPLRRLKITADYNRIWIENGGTLMGDGNYTVSPVADILSNYSDTPSRKRSEAKKKALLLTQLKEACTLSFQQFQH
jgi:uncharacterized protein VirK/YbjX